MRKRILSLALVLATVLVLLPASALAADSDFVIENGVLTKYNGPGGDVTIPSGVTSIGDGAFEGCRNLTSVAIPDGVTSIGIAAFYGCNRLTSAAIPASVTSIGKSAFCDCFALASVNIPDGVTSIGFHTFKDCDSLTSVTIPASVTSIRAEAFYGCDGLTSITIPYGVTTIHEFAFFQCSFVTSITIPASVTTIGVGAFGGIPETADVYYGGTEAQWKAMGIGDTNPVLEEKNRKGAPIHYNSATPEQPQQPAAETVASPTNDKLEVNGNAADPTVYKIGGSNYFKIRDVAALLNGTEKQFSVGYDGEKNAVTATTGQRYDKQSGDLAGAARGGDQSAAASNDAIYVNGEKITAEVYKIDGSNYFKLRDLGKALNFYVGWSADRGMYIETDKPYSD